MTGERGGPLELLAQVYQKLGDAKAERKALSDIVASSSDALPSLRRLIDLSREDGNWQLVKQFAGSVIAINPMLPEGQTALAEAAEQEGDFADAAGALRAMARMDPVDPASIDFRMLERCRNLVR